MQSNKVVVRFKDGTIIKGNTSDLFPNKANFHLNHHLDGKMEQVDVEELKAVFLLRISKAIRIIRKNMMMNSMGQDARLQLNLMMVSQLSVMLWVIHPIARAFS